ncbi:MAG TPA: DmsC/YnfH family molybdoenzyme membrane anchor subunit [Burkholderiales bacterium]|jgi:DMSO reductase anchor subunit|nr:DmsC/YnfH family molybdoenzyme membrane anchor subunit [Burkholderiales bacterium]
MHPAFSVIFLTTLIGVGQGLFVALFAAEVGARLDALPVQSPQFYVTGSALSIAFLAAGLIASFFHLGRPERAWRAAAMWRTSWLSREVIVLPAFMALVFVYGVLHYLGRPEALGAGVIALAMCLALFVCTAMIYACIKFLQEWATPLTTANFMLLGLASGYTFAAAYALVEAPALAPVYGRWAIAFTLMGLCIRIATLVRNARIRPRSSIQTAIGMKHPKIVQKAQGFMGGSFNTREFFHGKPAAVVRAVKWGFLIFAFAVPVALLAAGAYWAHPALTIAAFVLQYAGLVAERWFFFAQARHPQNLYYQAMS